MPKRTTIILLFCSLAVTTAWSANFGKISGQVVDKASGEPLLGANIMILGSTLGAVSDDQGYFVILQVPPGVYSVQAKVLGYAPIRVDQTMVATNRITTLTFRLSQTTLAGQEIEIIAERPVIEKDITATSRSVSSRDMSAMPATTVSEVLQTQPGVVSSGGLHIRGGRSGEITYYLDGIPMVDPLFTEINSSEIINRDAISEMQVISGTYSAEYGNSMSGIINITTKEGGEKLRADLNFKGSRIGVEPSSDDYNRNVLRGSLSGSLLPKTSFFLSANHDDRDNYLPWGYRRESSLFAKLTDRHLKNIKINLGINLSQGKRKSYSHSYKFIPDSYWYEPETDSRLAQLGFTHTLATNLYYSLNLYHSTYSYRSGDYDYNDLKPAYQLDENKEFYLQSYVTSYEKNEQSTLGLKGEMLWQANSYNEVKAGFELRQHTLDRFYISTPYYDDHILDNYERKPREAAAFIQDKINFSSIILSAGLRFDLFDPNAGFWPNPYDVYYNRTDQYKEAKVHTQLSPRLDISYPVSDKTVFHFGYGHYFQRPEYQYMYKSMTNLDYDKNMIMALRTGNGRFGNPDLNPEKTVTYEFGLSHQLLEDYLANVTVYSKKITNLVGARTFFAGSRSDIWETYSLHINEDFAYNNGIEFQFRKMRGRYITTEVNYTYAVAEGSSSGPLERVGVEEANRQTLKFFPLDFDQRHTVHAFLALQVPQNAGPRWGGLHWFEKIKAALLFEYGSGLAYTRGTRGATEPYEINNARLPEHWTLDLKIDREIAWLLTSTLFMVVPQLFAGLKDRAFATHNVGKVGYFTTNIGQFYPYGGQFEKTLEYPINSGHICMYRQCLMIGVPYNVVSAADGRFEEFDAIGGYNAGKAQIAMSDNPATWPASGWPVRDAGNNPVIISQQDSYCVYGDSTNWRYYNNKEKDKLLNLRVHQSIYAWGVPEADKFVVLKFEIENRSSAAYRNMYFNFYSDLDIGGNGNDTNEWADDCINFDKSRELIYFYDADNFSAEWGQPNPFLSGVTFLKTPNNKGISDWHWIDVGIDEVLVNNAMWDSLHYSLMSSDTSYFDLHPQRLFSSRAQSRQRHTL